MISKNSSTRSNPLVTGSAIALLSAIAFAFNLVLAGISYEYGANIHALNLSRAAGFLICLLLIVSSKGKGFKLPTKIRLASILVGVLLCAEMYTLLGAIRTIPVALAVLIFYTYPIIIAVYRWVRGQEPFSLIALGLLLIAFIGLITVLVQSTVSLDVIGIGFAAAAAVVMALMLITSEHSLNHYDNHVVLLHALAVVTIIVIVLSSTIVDLQWPTQAAGWLAFSGSSAFYVLATFCLFKAVRIIGPLKTAIVDNTAPVWAIVFGYLMLEQTLSFHQIIGAIVVIVAVISLQLIKTTKI